MTLEELNARPYLITNNTITKEQAEKLRACKLMIGTPMYDAQCCSTYHNAACELIKLCTKVGIPTVNNILFNESLINRARNSIANTFLESDCTHLIFIDADIGFNPLHVLTMLLCEKGVVGGAYAKKSLNFELGYKAHEKGVPWSHLNHCMGNFVFRPKENCQVKPFDLLPSKYLGTGFMMIEKSIFTRLSATCTKYKPNSGKPGEAGKIYFEFFPVGVVGEELLSEDYYFCELVSRLGEELWLAPWVYLTHMGKYEFCGCFFCSQGTLIHNIGQPQAVAPGQLSATDLLAKIEGKK
jgi:hypothetical protein